MKAEAADYYAILGIPPDAALAEIKKAYRRLAKQYHPDVNHRADAAARFREITEAYDTLCDPDKRRRYDRLRSTAGGSTRTGPGRPGGNGSTRGTGSRSSTGSSSAGDGPQRVSRVLKVLEDAWLEIRRRHPEIPPVVIIIASGTEGRHPKWGHHDPGRWNVSGITHSEVMISGEGLRRDPRDVLGTLLHEAAHALAAERGIKDTSRQGRYHNKKFRELAEELGLRTEESQHLGWSLTTVPDATAARYHGQLAALREAMTLWQLQEPATPAGTTRRSTNLIAATCSCDRIIRVAASTLAVAPITCEACDGKFEPRA